MNGILANKSFIFKILFALEIALLPLIVAFKILISPWAMSFVLGAILIVKIIMLIIKNPADTKQLILDAVGNFVVLSTILIIFASMHYISVALTVIAIILYGIEEVMKVYFFYKPNNQVVEALSFSVSLFMFVVIGSLMFIKISDIMTRISLFALIISTFVFDLLQTYIFIHYYIVKNKKSHKRKK